MVTPATHKHTHQTYTPDGDKDNYVAGDRRFRSSFWTTACRLSCWCTLMTVSPPVWGHQFFSTCPVQCRIGTFMKPKCSIAERCCYWWSGCTGVSGASSFTEAMKMGTETYHHLKAVIKAKYGQDGQSATLPPSLGLFLALCLYFVLCLFEIYT